MSIKIQFIALYTLVRREMSRILRIWVQALLAPVINIFLYFIIFGQIVGQRIGLIDGVPYLNFITPALIVIATINASYSQVSSSVFLARFQRNIEEMLISPIWHTTLIASFVIAGMIRGLLIALILYAFIVLIFPIQLYFSIPLVFHLALTSALFSLAGLINGMLAKDFDDIAFVPSFVITPLGFLGGAFYSINMLTPNWQMIAKINPLYYMIQSARADALHLHSVANLQITGLVIGFIFLLLMTYYLMKKPGFIRI